MRLISLVIALSVASSNALAQSQADFEKQALAYELHECIGAKVRGAAQFLTLQAQFAAAKKRDDAVGEKGGATSSEPSSQGGADRKE